MRKEEKAAEAAEHPATSSRQAPCHKPAHIYQPSETGLSLVKVTPRHGRKILEAKHNGGRGKGGHSSGTSSFTLQTGYCPRHAHKTGHGLVLVTLKHRNRISKAENNEVRGKGG